MYQKGVCPAALLSPGLALAPAYCLPAPSPATPLHALSVREVGGAAAGWRVAVSRIDQLPQLVLLTLTTHLHYTVDCG